MNGKSIEQTKDVYNKVAPFFSNTRKEMWGGFKTLAKYSKKGDKVLDLGCGNGRLYQILEEKQVDYTGTDQSTELLKIAQQKNPQLKFIEAEMTSLPFADNEFDIIYCIAVFHHLPDEESRVKALGEMKRVLRSGGLAVVVNWSLVDSDWVWNKVKQGKYKYLDNNDFIIPWRDGEGDILGERFYHGFTIEELKNLFEKVNFIVKEQYYIRKEKEGGKDNIVSIASS